LAASCDGAQRRGGPRHAPLALQRVGASRLRCRQHLRCRSLRILGVRASWLRGLQCIGRLRGCRFGVLFGHRSDRNRFGRQTRIHHRLWKRHSRQLGLLPMDLRRAGGWRQAALDGAVPVPEHERSDRQDDDHQQQHDRDVEAAGQNQLPDELAFFGGARYDEQIVRRRRGQPCGHGHRYRYRHRLRKPGDPRDSRRSSLRQGPRGDIRCRTNSGKLARASPAVPRAVSVCRVAGLAELRHGDDGQAREVTGSVWMR